MNSIFRLTAIVAATAALLGIGSTANAQIEGEAQAVFDRYTEALGGFDAYAQVKTAKWGMSMEIPAAGFKMEGLIAFKRPNKLLIDGSISGLGRMRKGFNGDVGWSMDAIQGVREMSGVELEKFVEESDMERELKLAERYASAKVATASPDGEIVVECVTKIGGHPERLLFDAESGLLRKRDYIEEMGEQGSVPVSAEIVTYEKIGGFLMQSRINASLMGMDSIALITSFEPNPPVEDSLFEMPE